MAGRRPVALATGFLDPYDYHVGGGSDHTQARPRSQYVVVVREDWTENDTFSINRIHESLDMNFISIKKHEM